MFPDDPPAFLARTPHGYFDEPTIRADMLNGGFEQPVQFDTVVARSHARACADPADRLLPGHADAQRDHGS